MHSGHLTIIDHQIFHCEPRHGSLCMLVTNNVFIMSADPHRTSMCVLLRQQLSTMTVHDVEAMDQHAGAIVRC